MDAPAAPDPPHRDGGLQLHCGPDGPDRPHRPLFHDTPSRSRCGGVGIEHRERVELYQPEITRRGSAGCTWARLHRCSSNQTAGPFGDACGPLSDHCPLVSVLVSPSADAGVPARSPGVGSPIGALGRGLGLALAWHWTSVMRVISFRKRPKDVQRREVVGSPVWRHSVVDVAPHRGSRRPRDVMEDPTPIPGKHCRGSCRHRSTHRRL